MHHIPTRTEMDEVQRAVTELRREVRALRKKPAALPVATRKAAAAKRKRK
jgi:hypothetical protein